MPDKSGMSETDTSPSKLKGFKSVSLLTLLSRITGLARDSQVYHTMLCVLILDAEARAARLAATKPRR